jgi:REP element-mobilizing transposase RayT
MGKGHFFGRIDGGKMRLSPIGKIMRNFWICTSRHFRNIHLDEFMVMPNHFHGIMIIKQPKANASNSLLLPAGNPSQNFPRLIAPVRLKSFPRPRNTLLVKTNRINRTGIKSSESFHDVICSFKSAAKNWCDKFGYNIFSWQPRFSESIISDEATLNNLRQHITTNPIRWEMDKHNPINYGKIGNHLID